MEENSAVTEEIKRPLTREEQRVFRARIGCHGPIFRFFRILAIAVLCVGTLATGGAFLAKEVPFVKEHQNALLLVFAVTGVFVGILFDHKTKFPAHTRPLAQELGRGLGLVRRFEIIDAIQVNEFEDNGYAFYLRLANGKVLYLMGQYLYEPTDQKRFPCTSLEVVYSPESQLVLSIGYGGEYLEPSSDLPSPSIEEFDKGKVPEDGTVIDSRSSKLEWKR